MKKLNFLSYKACYILMTIALIHTSGFAQLSGSYTINQGNPTSGSNFNSFADATTALKSSGVGGAVTITVVSNTGPYNEQIKIDTIPGVNASNTVTINGNGNTVNSIPTSTDRYMLRLNGATYVTINNLILFDSSDTYGWGVHLMNGADYNTINNCTIDLTAVTSTSSTNSAGIVAVASTTSLTTSGASASFNTFSNNTIKGGLSGGPYYAIRLNGGSGTVGCKGNKILNNTILDGYSYQIYLYYADSNLVEGNDISRPTKVTVSSFYGIYTSTGSYNNIIRNNKIHNTHDAASSLTGLVGCLYSSSADATSGNENKWYNNLIYDINNSGTIYGIYNSGSDYAQYFYNTISLDYTSATAGSTYGFYQSSAVTGVDFVNNNISITRGGSGTKYACYFSTNTSVINSNRNNLYVNSMGSGAQYTGYWSATTYSSLLDWQGANSNAFDQNSVATDPLYINPSGGLYKPGAASMNNIGTPISGITTDILMVTRNVSTPDPGAYEFTPALDDAGLTMFTGPIAPCPGSAAVQVELKNFGAASLDSVRINWEVNGVAQPVVYYTNSLQTGFDTLVDLGNISISSGVTYNIIAWTSHPNGSTDANKLNDSASYTVISALSGTYSVGSTGDFSTLVNAVNALNQRGVCGAVTFNVDPSSGPYVGAVSIGPLMGSSATNTVTFLGHGATITDTTDASRYYLVLLNSADYVTIDSFNIVNTGITYGILVLLTNGSDYNTISNCYLDNSSVTSTSSSTGGIALTGSLTSPSTSGDNGNYNTFINNTIDGGFGTGGIYYGIRLNGLSSVPSNIGNKVINNTLKDIYTYNVYVIYGDSVLIEGNDISRATKTTVSTFYGVLVTTGSQRCMIRNNKIHNTHDLASSTTGSVYGLYCAADATAGNENVFYNNLLYNVNGTGTIYAVYNSSAEYSSFYYNTITLDDTTASTGSTYGYYMSSGGPNITIQNNIFNVTRGGSGTKYGLYYQTSATNLVSDNNIVYVNSPGSGTQNVGYYGGAVSTFTAWQAVNSGAFEQNSDSANPMFLNPAMDNYTPNTISGNDIGSPISGITMDINGKMRHGTTPDAGAIEFTPIPANDSCSNAIMVTAGTYTGTTEGAFMDFAPACVVADDSSGGVWYQYTAKGDFAVASLCGSSFDTRMRVFTGTCASLVCVVGNEDSCGTQSLVGGCTDSMMYYILVYGNQGASGSFILDITETPVTKAVINVVGNTEFCAGDSAMLMADSNATYQWNDQSMSTTQSIAVYGTGVYQLFTTDANGCADTSETVSITEFALPEVDLGQDTTICNNVSLTLNAGAGFMHYTWSTGDTTQSITFQSSTPVTDTILVIVADTNGCENSDEVVVTVDICGGFDEFGSASSVKAFPNPSSDVVTIELSGFNSPEALVELFDFQGRIAFAKTIPTVQRSKLNFGEFERGIYLLRVSNDRQVNQIKMILK